MERPLNSEQERREARDASRRLERKLALKGFIADRIGVEEFEALMATAQSHREQGLNGVTLPTEDNTGWVTIDEQVSFRVGDYGPYAVPMEVVTELVHELHEEQLPPQPPA